MNKTEQLKKEVLEALKEILGYDRNIAVENIGEQIFITTSNDAFHSSDMKNVISVCEYYDSKDCNTVFPMFLKEGCIKICARHHE